MSLRRATPPSEGVVDVHRYVCIQAVYSGQRLLTAPYRNRTGSFRNVPESVSYALGKGDGQFESVERPGNGGKCVQR